ncbi:hypothetical protein DDZ18_00590 [Marinicauda salina]|uniref:Uncharacterized protein n=1 Tax=Marinicauda salina TaxID=2135793 RepID=A0A2U2BVU6_9PROT|nr:hypothetical protein [Marinicauda salina]PWE18146.1 hypothetical protein DDZ18_00590 [Marinicauda salina]
MTDGVVHFEVFVQKNAKASWRLFEACDARADAMEIAKTFLKANPAASVRVTREQYDPEERVFNAFTIFESGAEKLRDPVEKTGEATIPCLTTEDLAGPAARETVRRVLSTWLERRQVCPLELFHRADLVDELDADDNDLQHAIQKVAVARAQNSDASVHAYVRVITQLVQRAIDQKRRENRAHPTPSAKGGFAEMAERILSEGGPEKRLRAAVAAHLAEAPEMGRKAEMLLDLHDDLPADPEARALAEQAADAFLAEVLSFDRALDRVLGTTRDLGEQVERLTAVYEGAPGQPALDQAAECARRLAAKFKAKALPDSHGEIARRILDALQRPGRFKPDDFAAEIRLMRTLAQRLIAASGANLHPEALVEAFTHRSARLLSPDTVEEALAGAAGPVEQIARLMAMEDNLVGATNKKKLAAHIRARLKSAPAEAYFVRGPGAPFERLARLAAFQRRAREGSFPDEDKAELCEAFDATGLEVLDSTKVLDRVVASQKPALERALALLRLVDQNILPDGACARDGYHRARRLLASEEGRAQAADVAAAAALEEIRRLMEAVEARWSTDEEDAAPEAAADPDAA